MSTTPTITWKRGDSFEVDCVYKDAGGVAIDLDGVTITSQFRTPKGILISDADVTIGSPTTSGAFRVVVADTDEWPIGILEYDIEYALDGGSINSTETVFINVLRDVTRS